MRCDVSPRECREDPAIVALVLTISDPRTTGKNGHYDEAHYSKSSLRHWLPNAIRISCAPDTGRRYAALIVPLPDRTSTAAERGSLMRWLGAPSLRLTTAGGANYIGTSSDRPCAEHLDELL